MGFFSKKKEEEDKKDEESILKVELETEVEQLQKEFRIKQEEITKITEKIETVKSEYDITVSNLMSIKKEFNQKKMELDVVQREYRETREKIKNSQQIKDTKSINEFNKTEKVVVKLLFRIIFSCDDSFSISFFSCESPSYVFFSSYRLA